MDLKKTQKPHLMTKMRGVKQCLLISVLEGNGEDKPYFEAGYVYSKNGEFLGVFEQPTEFQSNVTSGKV